jgi:hypothetical protein
MNGFRVEKLSRNGATLLRLSGRIEAEYIPQLKAEIEADSVVTCLDLEEVKLLSSEVLTFLDTCERQGIELRNCPPYVREWITAARSS